ncbi:hypothetical protein PsYK624_061750 [Phanerochaete sordida]|uniref:Uncharacterized protein n=1 Tax=Phanerochaete sordida TaxID=48140 RepID=A0A9P3G6B0_9APHY|nr:hypothetical protein PsYK624_061750 [Phanerochaete sordida]
MYASLPCPPTQDANPPHSPFAIIDQVVSGSGLDRASASAADVADALKGRLRAAVVDHSGVVVGRTVGGAGGGSSVAEEDALPRAAAPELTLVSSAAALARSGGALAWCDWTAHGRVVEGRAWARLV